MTILWIYNQPLNPEAGGTERITSLVAKGLAKRGHTCLGILVFSEADGSMTYDGETITDLYRFLKDKKVDTVINQIAYAKWLLQSFLSKGGQKWHQEGGKIISCLHFDPCNPSVMQLLKSHEKWSFRDYINFVKFTLFKYHYTRRQRQTEGDIYNYIYSNSDAFVTLSATHFDYLKKVMKRNDLKNLFAIGNPLTFENVYSQNELCKKNNVILVCARMSEYHKRISIILKTWRILQKKQSIKDWTLKIVGDGPDLERYKRFVTGNRLERIEFMGQQNPEPFYRESKILLLTSSAEGWGLALTEAMQHGVVPVVMNSSSVYGEIITHLHDGILTPNDSIGQFAKTIDMLAGDSVKLDAMQRNAIRSSTKFTLPKSISKWQHLLTKL